MKFVIYSPPYASDSGGAIALHRLCDLINQTGHQARLWRLDWQHVYPGKVRSFYLNLYDKLALVVGKKTLSFPGFDTPYASPQDLADAIVIYPEVVYGNPLGSDRVVRWLLHQPGHHTRRIGYRATDLVFYFQKVFLTEDVTAAVGGELQVIHLRDDVYKRLNFGERRGSCHMFRKGKGRAPVHDVSASIPLDNQSHEEIAALFNQCARFVCYDPYTMYSHFAAMCGCLSIVVPVPGKDKFQWQPVEGMRYGIAYGFDDVAWARETAGLALGYFKEKERSDNATVTKFIDIAERHFASGRPPMVTLPRLV